jgi:uncharacterized membrane protein
MKTAYDQIAGRSVERLAALSDGIFGVAMTLLLLDLHVPAHELVKSNADLWRTLGDLAPQLFVYLMSFLTLGIFWIGQQTQLNYLTQSDRHLTWIHLGFLFAVTIMPFSTRLLTDYSEFQAALIVYWLNIVALGGMLYLTWGYATRARLVEPDLSLDIQSAVCRRIVIAQALYALGASLSFFSTYMSIAFIIVVQLNYVLAPGQWRWLRRT